MFSLPPSRRRWIIVLLIFVAMVLNYVDRQVVSILKPTLKLEFALDDRGYARLINVFTFAYAGTYALAGWLADRFGGGRMMLVGVISWSMACFSAGFTRTLGQLTWLRGALGAVEPLAFPAQLRVVTLWFPPTLRATANSICAAGGTIGAVVAPALIAGLALHYDWRTAFLVPGAVGVFVGLAWIVIYRDPPAEVARANTAVTGQPDEARFTWPQLWRTRSLWGILLVRFISDPVWYFCLFWLPGYLQERSGLTLAAIGLVGWIPFLVADIGGIGSSMVSDRLVKRGVENIRARKLVLSGAALFAPLCALTPYSGTPAGTLAIFSLVGMISLTWLFNLGVIVAETFPAANVGSVWGIAAACGAGGAMVFNTYVGRLMDTLGSARIFTVMAFLHPLAVLALWTMIRRERPPGDRSGQSVAAGA